MKLLLLIIGLGCIVYAALTFFKEISKTKKQIVIPLEDLSPLWTKYNEEIEQAPTEETHIDELFTDELLKENTPEQFSQETTTKAPTSDILRDFIKEYALPYKSTFEQQQVDDVFKAIIEILEKHGQNPSVCIDGKDQESISLISVRDNLAQITLLEHSILTTKILCNEIKQNYTHYENHMPKAIITALSHDLGKIPEFRLTGIYNTSDHALVGANKLNELLFGKTIFWGKEATKAVAEHHITTEDQFTQMLQSADRQARQQELLKFSTNYKIEPFENWFNTEEFFNKIEPYINVSQTGNKWQAFTFKGIVYCRPDFVYDTVKKMCKENKILDLTFVYESDKEKALRLIVNALKDKNYIPDTLKFGFYVCRFEILTQMGQKQRHMLIPIKIDPFLSKLTEIEKRKIGFFEIISSVSQI